MKPKAKLIQAIRKNTGTLIEHGDDGLACKLVRNGYVLCVIASWGEGWDHVSIHASNAADNFTPWWEDMCYAKNFFFKRSETVIQYHPPSDVYVNNHPHTLHLWRPQNTVIELPPVIMV